MMQFKPSKNMPHFTINGTLPSLNEYIAAIGRNPKAGGSMKRDAMDVVAWAIRSQLRKWKATKPIIIHYIIYEPNRKRDHDNVTSFLCKVTQDALQKCGVIHNDGWEHVLNHTHDFFVDKSNPRIEVYLEEVDG